MAVIHIGTETTLATVSKDDISNGDVAYAWIDSFSRKMVYDSTATNVGDVVNHPFRVRPSNYAGAGVWVEEVGADQPEAWSANQIRTGELQSINYSLATGSSYDLDNSTMKLGGSNVDADGSAAGVFLGLDSTVYKMYMGDGANQYFKYDGSNISWRGTNASLSTAGVFTATNVILTGSITAVTGSIGGWTLATGNLHSTNIYLDSASEKITINDQTFGNSGIQLDHNGGSPRLYAGDGSNQFIRYDSQGLSWQGTNASLTTAGVLNIANVNITGGIAAGFTADSTEGFYVGTGVTRVQMKAGVGIWSGATAFADAPFRVNNAGNLYASNATISGNITAESGNIGGWTLATGNLHSTNIYLDSDNEKITINDQTFGNEGIQLDYNSGSPQAYIGNSSTQFMRYDSDGLSWAGTNASLSTAGVLSVSNILATGGVVGGFTIDASDGFYAGSAATRIQMQKDVGIWSGATAFIDAPFRVNQAGHVYASSATISGAISAATIDIGGDDTSSFHVDINGGIWSGQSIANKATAPFRVNNAGNLYASNATISGDITAESGTIGGWTLATGNLHSSNIYLNSSDEKITINDQTFGNSGIQLDYNAGSPQAYLGNGSTQFMRYTTSQGLSWQGTNASLSTAGVLSVSNILATGGTVGGFTISSAEGLYAGSGATRVQMKASVGIWTGATAFGSAPFRVNQAGNLYASNATISGAITATSGTFTGTVNAGDGYFGGTTNGWVIASGSLTAKGTSIFQTSASASTGIKIDSTSIRGYNGSVQTVGIATDGSGWFGLSGTKAISWTTAGAVTIGGFSANASAFYAGSVATRIQLDTTSGIHLGATAFADAPFRVNLAGNLYASNATISGAITATSGSFTGSVYASLGTIGGWDIGADSLTSTNIGLHSASFASGAEILIGHASSYASAKIGLKNDGSGKLADGNISWTAGGVLMQSVDDGGAITIAQGADLTLEGGVSGDPSIMHLVSGTSANAVAEIRFEYIDETTYYHSIGMTTLFESGTIPHCALSIGPSDAITDDGASDLASVIVGGSWDGYSADYVRLIAGTQVYFSGPVYATGDVSALSFTDRTPAYSGDAVSDIKKIKSKGNKIDHDTLPSFAKKKIKNHAVNPKTGQLDIQEEPGRDIGAMISIITKAVQQISKRLDALEGDKNGTATD